MQNKTGKRIVFFWAVTTNLFIGTCGDARGAVALQINASGPGLTNPVCVRAIIKQSDGSIVPGEWGDPGDPAITMSGKAMAPGTVVEVLPGLTQITIGKGPDYVPQTITTNLIDGRSVTINVKLQPVFDMYERGWRTAEMHLHYLHGEMEIIRTPQNAWAICAGGGLNLVLFCEEHLGADALPRQQMYDLWKPYENTECQLGLGVEEPKNQWGHHANILTEPWSIRSSVPYSLGIHSTHQQGGVNYPVHPARLFPSRYFDDPVSGFRTWYLFPYNNFSKCYPLDQLIGHLTDAFSSVSDQGNTPEVLGPYSRLLQMGYRIPLLADSDFCMDRTNNGIKATGCWLTYYYLGDQPLNRAAIADAMRQGRVMATTGPLVLFQIDNAMSGDTLPADGASHTVKIQAAYTVNPWTLTSSNLSGTLPSAISEIDLYRNGQIINTWTPNTATATVEQTIRETQTNSYYMVRVLGNDPEWIAAYASPIYFDDSVRPQQPPAFKALVQGRLYDSASDLAVTGTVSSVRYGQTDWTIPTDSHGRFQAYVPLDAQLVAQDAQGRAFEQDILKYEPAYSFCHYLADNYGTNLEDSITDFSNLVAQMQWEFPMGYQLSPSYIKTNLDSDVVMSNFSVVSAPPFTTGKSNAEIVMVLVDKTQVQIGDTIDYAVIYRSPQNPPSDEMDVEWKGWNPEYPQMFTKYDQDFFIDNDPATLVSLGGGFYLRAGSAVVPSWTANVSPTTAAIDMWVTTRTAGVVDEDVQLLFALGPTRRQLLVNSTWDGLPASWAEIGIGPCNFRRDYTDFLVRYSDYRFSVITFTLNGSAVTLNPKVDTAHTADADDAIFYEPFYYDGQCEPQWRNIPFRDPVRAQPAWPSFADVPIANPPDKTPPSVVAIQPANGVPVAQTNIYFYFLVDDAGLSGPADATLYVDGRAVTNSTTSPVLLKVSRGAHTWMVQGRDNAGNTAFSSTNIFLAGVSPPTVRITAPNPNAVIFGTNVTVEASAASSLGISNVQFTLDGNSFGAARSRAPYELSWDTSSVTNGTHELGAVASDEFGQQTISAPVTVTVSNFFVYTNTVWVEDAVPAGAVAASDGGDSWDWVSSNPAPLSGALAIQSDIAPGEHELYFYNATNELDVGSNDILFACVYLDPTNLPAEVMLQWEDSSGSWEHRAYWGADDVSDWGVDGTPSMWRAGNLPAAGQWVKLSVPANQVGLGSSPVIGMAFTLYGGRATWDYAGRTAVLLQTKSAGSGTGTSSGGAFAASKGTYTGLFSDPSSGVAQQSSGAFILSLTAKGAFSGKVQIGASHDTFSGQLDDNGAAVVKTKGNGGPLAVTLQVTAGSGQISGTVAGPSWNAQLSGYLEKPSSSFTGGYSLAIAGGTNSATAPAGAGFATVKVSKTAELTLVGTLADGTKISQSSAVSTGGQWPLYLALYNGKGSIWSWVTFSSTVELGSDFLSWIKPQGAPRDNYGNGFSLGTTVTGSAYHSGNALSFTNGELIFEKGGITTTNQVTVNNNTVTLSGAKKPLLNFTGSSGVFSGCLETNGNKLTLRGVALQNTNIAVGFFLNDGSSGQIQLLPSSADP